MIIGSNFQSLKSKWLGLFKDVQTHNVGLAIVWGLKLWFILSEIIKISSSEFPMVLQYPKSILI